jgi:ribosome biogenesis protein BMS1
VTVAALGEKVQKKLRVAGHPGDVFEKTVVIRDLFTSAVEAERFVGASIRTVSGIRGVIKKASQDGAVRCTFEDRLKPSDEIFLNTWVTVPVPNVVRPLTNLVTDEWDLVRTTAQVRAALGILPPPLEEPRDEVPRPQYPEGELKVPARLQKQLPYDVRKKYEKEPKRAVMLNEDERELAAVVGQAKAVFERKKREREERDEWERIREAKAKAKEEAALLHKRTKRKQEFFKKRPSWAKKK